MNCHYDAQWPRRTTGDELGTLSAMPPCASAHGLVIVAERTAPAMPVKLEPFD